MRQPGAFDDVWDGGEPRKLPAGRAVPTGRPAMGPAQAWQAAAGDAAWAAALAGPAAADPSAIVYLVYAAGTDVLALFDEALRLLPEPQRWLVTFNTYLTEAPAGGTTCAWRGVVAGTPAAAMARGTVIDLTALDPSQVPSGPLAERARTGRAAIAATVELKPEVADDVGESVTRETNEPATPRPATARWPASPKSQPASPVAPADLRGQMVAVPPVGRPGALPFNVRLGGATATPSKKRLAPLIIAASLGGVALAAVGITAAVTLSSKPRQESSNTSAVHADAVKNSPSSKAPRSKSPAKLDPEGVRVVQAMLTPYVQKLPAVAGSLFAVLARLHATTPAPTGEHVTAEEVVASEAAGGKGTLSSDSARAGTINRIAAGNVNGVSKSADAGTSGPKPTLSPVVETVTTSPGSSAEIVVAAPPLLPDHSTSATDKFVIGKNEKFTLPKGKLYRIVSVTGLNGWGPTNKIPAAVVNGLTSGFTRFDMAHKKLSQAAFSIFVDDNGTLSCDYKTRLPPEKYLNVGDSSKVPADQQVTVRAVQNITSVNVKVCFQTETIDSRGKLSTRNEELTVQLVPELKDQR